MIADVKRVSDAEIIAQSCTRPIAFAELFDRYADDVYRFAARRLGAQIAEDIVSEAFSIAFQRRHRYDVSRPDARPWLLGIVTNLGRRHRRVEARRWRAVASADRPAETESMADRVAARVSAQAIRPRLAAALASMSPRHRDVLLLSAWAELDYAEIAAALDIPVGTVRSRLHRGRTALRSALGEANPVTVDPKERHE